MIKKLKSFRQEDGIGVVWFALSFVVIAFIAGMAIDGGRLYLAKAQLRKAADAAVLSGGQELVTSESAVKDMVNQILTAHNELDSLKHLDIRPNNEPILSVTLERSIPLSFMAIFGFKNAPVSVKSAAEINPMVETSGFVPFGISDEAQIDFNTEYTLKVDAGDSSAGNFGILALAGVGGQLYEDALKYGYNEDIHARDGDTPGDIIDTQTGNVEQKTVEGVNYRIDESQYATGDRDDPRLVKILIYTPHEVSTNQIKSVEIVGFAYFYLEQPMSKSDSTVTGYFREYVGTGEGDANALDGGAYAIKLVE